ncbi:hypothetical protein AB0D09_13900 [Streptomyces sp. NPDC049097]
MHHDGDRSVFDAISAADALLVAEAQVVGAQESDGESGLPVPA